MVIHKVALQRDVIMQTVMLPPGAQILSIQRQNGHPGYQMWYSYKEKLGAQLVYESRQIESINTGDTVDSSPRIYLATVQDLSHVTHFYERIPFYFAARPLEPLLDAITHSTMDLQDGVADMGSVKISYRSLVDLLRTIVARTRRNIEKQ